MDAFSSSDAMRSQSSRHSQEPTASPLCSSKQRSQKTPSSNKSKTDNTNVAVSTKLRAGTALYCITSTIKPCLLRRKRSHLLPTKKTQPTKTSCYHALLFFIYFLIDPLSKRSKGFPKDNRMCQKSPVRSTTSEPSDSKKERMALTKKQNTCISKECEEPVTIITNT